MSPISYQWFKCEYFYSFADRLFFLNNELSLALEGAELPGSYTSREWAILRRALRFSIYSHGEEDFSVGGGDDRPPRRRLFSCDFIEGERRKLSQHRVIFREIMK